MTVRRETPISFAMVELLPLALDYHSVARRLPMLREQIPDLAKYVEPDRVRREVYTDPDVFEFEMHRIHERVWIYCGHESQIPKAGDYYAVQIGRQPMLMVRSGDGKIHVLYNRCPHRG